MFISIYNRSNTLIYSGNCELKQKFRVMGEETSTVTVVSESAISFNYGDYVDVYGSRFYLHTTPNKTDAGTHLVYTLTFESVKYKLFGVILQSFGRAKYDITTDLEGWCKLIVENANRIDSGWSYVINEPAVGFKTLVVDEETCLSAVNRIFSEFNREFRFVGKQLVVGRVGADLENTLKVGKYQGAYQIIEEQDGTASPITRLYVYGSDKNLPTNYNNADGSTPTDRLTIKAVNGGLAYIEDAAKVALYGVIEGSYTNNDIFPHRTGTLSAVDAKDVQNFIDNSIDFDFNAQLLPGISGKVTFVTGDLSGYTFDVVSYNATTKQVRIAVGNDGSGKELPNATFKPKVGDKYVFTDIAMPQSYITTSETDLKTDGTNEYNKVSCWQKNFKLTAIDPIYQQDLNFYPTPGDKFGVESGGVVQQVRIVEYSVNRTTEVPIYDGVQLADKVEPSLSQKEANQQQSTSTNIYIANKGAKDANVAAKTVTYALYDMFEIVNQGTPSAFIRAKYELHSLKDIVAFSNGTEGGAAPTIPLATYATVGVVKVDPTTMTVDANGMIAVKGDLFNLSNYYTKTDSDARFAALGHVHAFSELTGKPTTISEYGITDAMTTSQISTAIAQAKADIVNSSPAALDTLNELATALGNDPNFATTTATALGNRLRVDISTQGLTDTQRANGRANLGLGMLSAGDAGSLRITTPTGSCDIGSQNTVWFHFLTDRPQFYMNKGLAVDGEIRVYNTSTYLNSTTGAIAGNAIIHAGNIGSQSTNYANTAGSTPTLSSVGNQTAITGTTRHPSGLRLAGIYGNGYPFDYGNTIQIHGGLFGSELAFNCLGGAGATGTGSMWFRTQSNWGNSEWGAFKMLWDTSNLNNSSTDFNAKDINASDIYSRSWIRNYTDGYGLYNQSTSNYLYASDKLWHIGREGNNGIQVYCGGYNRNRVGVLYGETSGNFGLLNSGGAWGVRLNPGGQDAGGTLYGGWAVTGAITAAGDITAFSDRKLKDNLCRLTGVLDKLDGISAYTYTRNDLDGKNEMGMIAQEVEKVFPLLVSANNEGVKSLNYMKFTAVLLAAVKELREEIKNLKR